MAAPAPPAATVRATFWSSTIGKKVVMAVTGVVLYGFVVGHLVGNLQIFAGPEPLNAYAAFLKASPALLWGTRLLLLAAVALHIVAAVQLIALQRRARPVRYAQHDRIAASYASRTMNWSGPLLALYVVYHLLHFTTGQAHPDFDAADVYRNMVIGFSSPVVSGVYIAAMALLTAHLYHGFWSMLQTIGLNGARSDRTVRRFSAGAALLIGAGYVAIPVAVLAGWVQ